MKTDTIQTRRPGRARSVMLNALAGLCLTAASLSATAPAHADAGFQKWIADFASVAAAQGIQRSTYDRAFEGVTIPDPEVLEKARYQPEFRSQIWDYLDTRVNPFTVGIGQQMLQRHRSTLDAVEQRFGIPRSVILAIWSMETNYGAVLERPERLHYVPQALATLAYADSRRARFGREQLIAALKILQSGDIGREQLSGSWAGAMGHTQFIPTSYLAYAVDMDGNGKRDIWRSIPDALGTAASLLSKNGWQNGKTWGYEAAAPSGASRYDGQTKTLAEWERLGFRRPNGQGFPRGDDRAELKFFAGANGPAFLVMRNFFIIKRYNNSDSYALAVGLLADQIAGHGAMAQSWPRPAGTLSMEEKFEIQTRLKSLGYYGGEIDGNLGSGSQAAIRDFQTRIGMEADGVPNTSVLERLRR
jgi:membrane-bound lytic murein transglycosylase B